MLALRERAAALSLPRRLHLAPRPQDEALRFMVAMAPQHRLDAFDGEACETPLREQLRFAERAAHGFDLRGPDHVVGSEPERVVVLDHADLDAVELVVDPLPFPHGLRPQPAETFMDHFDQGLCDGHADEGRGEHEPDERIWELAQLVSAPRHEGGSADAEYQAHEEECPVGHRQETSRMRRAVRMVLAWMSTESSMSRA